MDPRNGSVPIRWFEGEPGLAFLEVAGQGISGSASVTVAKRSRRGREMNGLGGRSIAERGSRPPRAAGDEL